MLNGTQSGNFNRRYVAPSHTDELEKLRREFVCKRREGKGFYVHTRDTIPSVTASGYDRREFGWVSGAVVRRGLVECHIYACVMRILRCLFAALFLWRISANARRGYALCKVPARASPGNGKSLHFLTWDANNGGERMFARCIAHRLFQNCPKSMA